MEHKDYYHIMGVAKDATEKDIKMAYRRLARKYHPDLNKEPHAEEKFKELGEAYEVLRDPSKRKIYDEHEAQQKAGFSSTDGASWSGGDRSFSYDSDFFESLFGAAPHFRREAAPDVHATLTIRLEDAYQGAVKECHFASKNSCRCYIRTKITFTRTRRGCLPRWAYGRSLFDFARRKTPDI